MQTVGMEAKVETAEMEEMDMALVFGLQTAVAEVMVETAETEDKVAKEEREANLFPTRTLLC